MHNMSEEEIIKITMGIANSGNAKSLAIEAVMAAESGDFETSEDKYRQSKEAFMKVHEAHLGFLQAEANGESIVFSMLLMHMEDHIMTTSIYLELAKSHIALLKRVDKLEKSK